MLDLLQGAGGGQQVLAVVGRIEDQHLRAQGCTDSHREDHCDDWGDRNDMIFAGHHMASGVILGRRSAAQATPLAANQADAKFSRPAVARATAMAA